MLVKLLKNNYFTLGSNYSENFASNLVTKWFLHEYLLFHINLLTFNIRKLKMKTNLITVEVIVFWFFEIFPTIQNSGQVKKKWVNLWEQMRSTVKLQNLSMVFQQIFIISIIFNINIHSFSKRMFFVLKFLFIEVINSIYLILVQYVPALLLMYYITQTCAATHKT